jgi:eukaryotic-like serine/threonine-protein kinase
MRITLTVETGPHAGKVFSFTGHDMFLVGRSKNAHFRFDRQDMYFSRLHFMVEVNPPLCRILDMNSRNGTFVNNQRVQSAELHDGDLIKAGHTTLRVALVAEPEAPAYPGGRPSEEELVPLLPVEDGPTARPAPVATLAAPPAPPSLVPPPPRPSTPPAPVPPQAVPVLTPGAPLPQTLPPSAGPAVTIPGLPPLPPRPAAACVTCALPLHGPGPLCPACSASADGLEQFVPGYRLVRELGRGGMGVVWLGVRLAGNSAVAVKTILPAVSGDASKVQRFLREAEVLRQLEHPNIVAFRDSGEAAGRVFFVMDYVRGSDLAKLLKERGRLDVSPAVRIINQVLLALAHAHARRYVHRDIKPGNVLLAEAPDGRRAVKVADFGLARVYQASQLSGLTMGGDIGGTPAYLPPEQITHFRDVSPAADQYSTAAMLYHVLTGKYAFDFPQGQLLGLVKILEEDPVPIRQRRADLPESLARVVHKAMSREPADRYADVEALRQALMPFAT